MSLIAQIDSHFGLFLVHLIQAGDNELVLFLHEARVNSEEIKELKFNEATAHEVTLKTNPIQSDESSKKYKVTFRDFLVYQTAEESSLAWSNDEVFTGKLFRIFSKSRYLDQVESHLSTAFYEECYGKKYHFEFPCLNYIVDVISAEEPSIEEVEDFQFHNRK